MLAAMRRARLLIRGLVQGVSYRASTVDAARRIGGLTGWVRNQPDGSVVCEAQGAADKVDALIAWCEDGPPHAQVDRVQVIDVPTLNDEKAFTIER
jgi:acylphosphatase